MAESNQEDCFGNDRPRPAAAACGRRDSSNALKRITQVQPAAHHGSQNYTPNQMHHQGTAIPQPCFGCRHFQECRRQREQRLTQYFDKHNRE